MSKYGTPVDARLALLRSPTGYNVTESEWTRWMTEAAVRGCDWVEWMQEHNPMLAQSIDDAAVRHAALLAEVREVLEAVEWSVMMFDNDGSSYIGCASCSVGAKIAKHAPDCRLAALLARLPARTIGEQP